MSIGSKIKAIRKKQGMTQNALAENIVSRSMLSRIESGSAEPSVGSLKAIASRLGVSAGFFLEDDEDLLPAERSFYSKHLYEKLSKNDYQACLDIFSKTDLLHKKEYSGIYAHCAFMTAIDDFNRGNFTKAKSILQNIKPILPDIDVAIPSVSEERIDCLISIMENVSAVESLHTLAPGAPDFAFQPSLFLFLLNLLHSGRTSDCLTFLEFCKLEGYYSDYLRAQILIKDYKFIDAILILKSIYIKDDIPVFVKLLCYSSIENCSKLCEDYKGAYENRLMITSTLESIK